VGGIPGTESKWAFLIVTFLLVMIGLLLIALFRRIKWL
jgi:Mg2+ and Co2+ transporter CorA